jgi:hypothetical protein
MTLRLDGTDIGTALEVAGVVGAIIAMLIAGLVIYLMVRPPRHQRREVQEADPLVAEEMLRLMDRMEQRLEILERAVSDEAKVHKILTKTGPQAPDMRRMK